MSQVADESGSLVISLDFELYWGMFDVASVADYAGNILGVREAVPAMLRMFREYAVRVTWAVVGFVTFETRRDLLAYAPDVRPQILDTRRDPYVHLRNVGEDERRDPLHFGYSLVQRILETPGMELGSHTFSHLCCLEPRANRDALFADLSAATRASERLGSRPTSLVFPRNQYDTFHLAEAHRAGFAAFRGNGDHRLNQPVTAAELTPVRRALRTADAYVNLTGHQTRDPRLDRQGMVDVAGSRFLRPVSPAWSPLEPFRRRRVIDAMRAAAARKTMFHLWWHPHNFGVQLERNMSFLRTILEEYRRLHDARGFRSLTMAEAASAALGQA